nr:class I mannose-6-phosphate isomerase [Qipengyuania sphaerica]
MLPTRSVAKVWGKKDLPAPFVNPGEEAIGEIWFEPPAALPELLVKYIFASEKLSVQTHPDDDQAEAAGMGRQGKEECWIILDAEKDARIAVGFREEIDSDRMRSAALDGSIEDLLVWHEVKAGDFFYIPANTVHAIGGGVSLLEIQQNSDITYRLYDYGRPRELHLEDGIRVADGKPHPEELRVNIPQGGSIRLVDGPHFRLDRVDASQGFEQSDYEGSALFVIPTAGHASVDGETVSTGNCAIAHDIGTVSFSPDALCFLVQPVT